MKQKDSLSMLIGIAGETASGKSTFCARLLDRTPPGQVKVVSLDSYYRSQEHLPVAERGQVNFDHPDALDYELLIDHVDKLCQGQDVQIPVYDFHSHVRLADTIELTWTPVIVVEGILALYWEELRRSYDYRIYVDAPENLRLKRRIARDTADRGRTRQSVIDQWKSSVQTMSAEFCVPTRQYADLIVDGEATDGTQLNKVLSLFTDTGCGRLS
jgi:uridine kinase